MEWFWIALAAPLLWAITNFIDKLLITKYLEGGNVGTLTIFSGLIGFLVAPIILVLRFNKILLSFNQSLILVLSGLIYIVSLVPYLYSLEKEDTSLVIPLFQLVPVFAFVLGMIFLKEFLTINQIIGGIIILFGSVFLSLELGSKKFSIKKSILMLMIVSSLGVAIYSLLFKSVSVGIDYWVASFWFYLGFGIGGILFLFYRPYRVQFMKIFKANPKSVIGLNMANESINVIAVILINIAFILGPLSLVWIVVGFQPFFSVMIGIFLTLFFPKLIQENMSKSHLIHKTIAIIIILIGSVVINL